MLRSIQGMAAGQPVADCLLGVSPACRSMKLPLLITCMSTAETLTALPGLEQWHWLDTTVDVVSRQSTLRCNLRDQVAEVQRCRRMITRILVTVLRTGVSSSTRSVR